MVEQTSSIRASRFVYGILALSIVIAVFGIVLTLLLAVYERRHETGLPLPRCGDDARPSAGDGSVGERADVGVRRGRRSGHGSGRRYVVIAALRDQGLTKYSVPVPTIGVILVIAFVVGVVAAVVPAWRATKLDILQAIATE
jgi:putative ABC transport system permease protein